MLHETLASDLIVVLEPTADGGISVRASAGEDAPQPPEPSPPSCAARSASCGGGETLLSSDLRSETPSARPGSRPSGCVSLVAAPIGVGSGGVRRARGVQPPPAAFSEDDLAFVESIANVLMAAVERERAVVARGRSGVADGREFWELSLDLLAVFSPDGRFLKVSGAWEQTLGWTPQELIGRSALELVVAEDRAATVAERAASAIAGGETVPEVVNRYRAKDGSSRWLLWSVHTGPDGTLLRRRQGHHRALRAAGAATRREEQLNDAQRLAQMGSWETDFASRTAHAVGEPARDARAGLLRQHRRTLPRRVHPEDRERMRAVMATHPDDDATGRVPRAAAGRPRPDRSPRVVRPIYDEAGHPDGPARHGQGRHGGAPRRGALRRSEERFRQGFDNAPIAMALVDPARPRATCASTTHSAPWSAAPARRSSSCPSPRSATPTTCRPIGRGMRRLAERRARPASSTEKRYVRPDGSEVWASISVTPVREPDGAVDVLFGQMVDITERKAREA